MEKLSIVKKHKVEFIVGPLFKLVEVIFELLTPFVVRDIINNGFFVSSEGIVTGGDRTYIIIRGCVILSFAIFGFLSTMVCQYLGCKASSASEEEIKNQIMEHYLALSKKEIDKYGRGNILTHLSSDAKNVGSMVMLAIRLLIRAPILVVGSLICSFIINPLMGVIFLSAAVLVSLIMFFIIRYSAKSYFKVQSSLDDISTLTSDNIEGSRTIKAFNKSKFEVEKYDKELNKYRGLNIKLGLVNALSNPLTFLFVNIAIILIIYLGGQYVSLGIFENGDVIALINYLNQMLVALVVISDLIVVFTRGIASKSRIEGFLKLENEMDYSNSNKEITEFIAPVFEFNDVSFGFEDNNVVSDISFKINKGEIIGLIGATGSGKSVILNLMNRLYDPTKGKILYKGIDLKEYNVDSLHNDITYIMQKNGLFSGTVLYNLTLGREYKEEEINNALKSALAYDFVYAHKSGLSYHINEGAKNLSGGQRQRLLLARALLANKQVLILDDSLSALDYMTDAQIRKNIRKYNKDITLIIVSEKLSSINDANHILVLENGLLVNDDNAAKLENDSIIYKEMKQIEEDGIWKRKD